MKVRKIIDLIKKSCLLILMISVIALSLTTFSCIDDSQVEYNTYSINSITPPVDRNDDQQKKVYIGHSFPVNVILTAEYTEENIPLQFYLLNVDDISDVEEGIVFIDDIRMYYCHQTEHTNINLVNAGTNTYGVVINIPADQSKDKYTDDFKVGTYYVLAEVDKNDEAEIDPFIVYEKFKDKLDDENTIVIASDFMSKPDLSISEANFTGTKDDPRDSLIFYDLDLTKLPGAQAANLGIIYLKPTISGTAFTGSVDVKSSSNDALNVPVIFYLTHDDWADDEKIQLEIYDDKMGGFIEEYYIPILRKNSSENINLQLRVPDETGPINFFSLYGTENWSESQWGAADKSLYPLFKLRYKLLQMEPDSEDGNKEYYDFKLVAEVNPDGKVTESRFIKPNNDNTTYDKDDFDENGDIYDENTVPVNTKENNITTEDIIISVESIEVKANEGTKFYPCSAIDADGDGDKGDDDDCGYDLGERKFVIWWGGWGASIGKNELGASIGAHAGMFFSNYSLFSAGVNLNMHVSDFIAGTNIISADTGFRLNLNAESHPFDADKSYYEFVTYGGILPGPGMPVPGVEVEWGDDEDWWQGYLQFFVFKDDNKGFGEYDIETPVTFSKFDLSFDFEFAGIGAQIRVGGGFGGWYILPRTKIFLNQDGSLRYDIGLSVTKGFEVEVSVGAFDWISAGIIGGIDFVTLDLGIGFFTKTFYNEATYPGQVRGCLGVGPEIWLTGPQGFLKVYFEIGLLFFDIRIEQTILSFQALKYKLYDTPFSESGKTNWVPVEDANKIDYTVLDEDDEDNEEL